MKLRDYQAIDAVFLAQTMTSACFNEQRTGKTPTALAMVKLKKVQKVVIICPGSAVYIWKEEYEKWLNQPCVALVGTPKKRQELLETWTHGLVVSYDTFKQTLNSKGMVDAILAMKPEFIIADEAHRFKTPKSAVANAIFKTTCIPHRLALTGTPAPGKAHEIYSILHWLFPHRFPSYWKFVAEYFYQDRKFGSGGRQYIEILGFKKEKQIELQEFLNQVSTQRKRIEVMPWLKPKNIVPVLLPCTKYQEKYLKELLDYFETEHIVTQGVLDRLMRYRQICLDPGLLNLKGTSPKTDWIIEYIKDYPEKSVIIFSKFTSYIKRLSNTLITYDINNHMIIGETPLQQRKDNVTDFQKGKYKVLLLNIDAGKEALTLDKAEVAIFTDKYPPIGTIEQAEDRFVATTEDKKDKETTIYDLIMKNTYDENIHEMLIQRKTETDLINDFKRHCK